MSQWLTSHELFESHESHNVWRFVKAIVLIIFYFFTVEPYIITGLSHNSEYEIRAATRNKAGLSDFTPVVTVKTLQLQADQVTAGSPLCRPFSVESLILALMASLKMVLTS